jgi:hypothetical protein
MFILDIGAASLYQRPAPLQIVPIVLVYLFSAAAQAEQNPAHPKQSSEKGWRGTLSKLLLRADFIITPTAASSYKGRDHRQILYNAHGRLLLLKKKYRPDPDNQFLTKYNKLPLCITVKCCLQTYIYDVPYVYNLSVKKKKTGKFQNLGEGV